MLGLNELLNNALEFVKKKKFIQMNKVHSLKSIYFVKRNS